MTPTFRRRALASALALALTQASAATIDQRTAVPAQRVDAATIAAAATNPDLIILRAGIFDPASQRLNARLSGAADTLSSSYAIVQFHGPDLASGRTALETKGATILGYIPNNAYFVKLNNVSLDAIKHSAGVRSAELYAASYKVDPRLWQDARHLLLQQSPEDVSDSQEVMDIVDVRGFKGESSAQIEAGLRKLVPGVRITSRSRRVDATPYVHAGVPREQLDQLLHAASLLDSVAYIEPWLPTTVNNAASVGAIQGNLLGNCSGNGAACGPTPIWDHGIIGSGQIVAVADSGTSPWVANFTTLNKGSGPLTQITLSDNPPPVLPAIGNTYPDRKIFAYWLQPSLGGVGPVDYDYTSGHGTHTSGTVLGDVAGTFTSGTYLASTPSAANHELADGMAPNAQLLMQDIGGTSSTSVYVSDFAGTLDQAYAGGARIHSNSWGSSTAGIYSSNDSEADATSWLNEDMLIVVSAGNDDPGPVQTGSPSNAKNVLSVAALGHAGSTVVAGYSNRGPAADGRQKPDIAAPGSAVQSARNTSSFSSVPVFTNPVAFSGTSMAAPTISGNAALVRQYFADGFYPRGIKTAADAYNPSGMMLKAVLLNGTNPLGAPNWPNSASGWGRAWLDGNLWFKSTLAGGDDSRRLRMFERTQAAGMKTGEVKEYTINNVAGNAELRVTLTWFDPEAAGGAGMALINNLDLEVVAPNASVYKGNVFASGVSITGGAADARDSVEQVRLTNPQPGAYTIRVKATSVPGNGRPQSDTQGYAVVASGAFAMPDPAPLAAPTAISVSSNDASGIAVSFSAAAAQRFQLYRADGTCATAAAGDFRLVSDSGSSPVIDDKSQGGKSYAYKVRGVAGDVEGNVSTCVDVVSADDCTLQPVIQSASLNVDGANNTCSNELSWQAGTATCPASSGMSYTVYRSSDPFMAGATAIASGIPTTNYSDTAVQNGHAYYYRFDAEDSFGNASPLSAVVGATPTSALGPDPDPFVDNVDNATYLVAESPWAISSITAANGNLSYHTGGQGSNYPDLTCASIETPSLTLGSNAQLTFAARYNFEFGWDGVVTEISTNGGASWTDLPPAGGYPTVFNTGQPSPINACGFAEGKGIYSGVSTAASNADPDNDNATAVFKPFSADLSSYSGQTVKIRWRMSSDPGLNYSGMFLDQVRIGNADSIFENSFDFSNYMCQ
ncbi:MAG TPA: S8 family serine peptidase [Dokdonella sp.]|uniref:S8 family serine peptidase n=1 Tax=Dokdonella sp. TaxID=2291710 RepID=UPI002D80BA13|nr:S8 family serine peptidase [Dokdonella sp.]HET9031542.1 S8 family serine peptidase [Dokdonella sp.]